jgi:hypothetical protein
MQNLSAAQVRILPKAAPAQKHNCTVQYVRKVLQGSSACNSLRARSICQDAIAILKIPAHSPSPDMPGWCTNQTLKSEGLDIYNFYTCKNM